MQFTKNPSLKRFILRAELDSVTELLPYLFRHTHFAPQLETLVIVINQISSQGFPSFANFKLLDQYIRSRPSLGKIIISRDRVLEKPDWLAEDREKNWQLVKIKMRTHLPQCEESHLMEFTQGAWETREPGLLYD